MVYISISTLKACISNILKNYTLGFQDNAQKRKSFITKIF